MPQAIPIIVAGVAAGVTVTTTAGAITIGFSMTAALIGASLAAVSMALAPKPQVPNFNANLTNLETAAADREQSFRQPITTRKLAYGLIKAGGPIINIDTTELGIDDTKAAHGKNSLLHMFVVHASHEIDSIEAFYIDGTEIANTISADTFASNTATSGITGLYSGSLAAGTNAKYRRTVNQIGGIGTSHLFINPHLGGSSQVADPDAVAAISGWTSNHVLNDVFYNYYRFRYNDDLFHGLPVVGVRFKGKKVFDPRDSSTAYSANSALVLYDYLTSPLGLNVPTSKMNNTSFIAAANICDEDVSLPQGGTEKRYEANGMIDTAAQVGKNIEDILTSMSGTLVYTNGQFSVFAGAAKTAVLSFDENDVVGDVTIAPRMSRRENFNAVKGKYVAPENNYQLSDYPAITSTVFEAEDNNERIFAEFDLPFTTSSSMAQRIAKINLNRNRQPLAIDTTLSLAALPLICGDVFEFTFERFGFASKKFELTQWGLIVNDRKLQIKISAKEYSDDVYDFTASDLQIVLSAPNTTIPDVLNLEPPTNLQAIEEQRTTRDGRGVQSVLNVTYTLADDAFAYFYELEFKKSTDSTFTSGGITTGTSFELLDLAPASYDVRIRSVSLIGNKSDYVQAIGNVAGFGAAPTNMTGLSLQEIGGMALLQWTQSTDLDVRVGGTIEIRHAGVGVTNSWPTSTLVDDSVSGIATQAIVPLRAGNYLLKFIDAFGNKQTDATTVAADGDTILDFTDGTSATENPSFAGTKTNVIVIDNNLKLVGATLLDSISDFDSIENFDNTGGTQSTGTYEFANQIDLGSVTRARLTAKVTSVATLQNDLIDNRTANIDTWDDFDGTAGAQPTNIEVYFASTDDDPSGSPSFTSFKLFQQTEVRARAFKFKAVLTTSDPAYNVSCSALAVTSATI